MEIHVHSVMLIVLTVLPPLFVVPVRMDIHISAILVLHVPNLTVNNVLLLPLPVQHVIVDILLMLVGVPLAQDVMPVLMLLPVHLV